MRRRALGCNSTVDSSLTSPLTFGFYTLQANGGDVYQFRAARPGASGGFVPSPRSTIQRARVAVPAAGSASGHAASTATITFPASGKFSVIVSALSTADWAAIPWPLRLNRPCDGVQALSCSSVVDGAVNGLIRSQVYALTASANDSYLVRLLRPDAGILFGRASISTITRATPSCSSIPPTSPANFTVPADGTYTLVVTDSFEARKAVRLRSPYCVSTGLAMPER